MIISKGPDELPINPFNAGFSSSGRNNNLRMGTVERDRGKNKGFASGFFK